MTAVPSLPGQQTLLASWAALALHSPNARLIRSATAPAAVFPSWAPLNNAVVTDVAKLADAAARAAVAEEVARSYAAEGIGAWALWVPSDRADLEAPDEVADVGELKRDTTTLVMTLELSHPFRPRQGGVFRSSIRTAGRATDEAVPAGELDEPDDVPGLCGWVVVRDDLAVAGAWSMLHGRDCGIYAVGTVPEWRGRGIARTLMMHVLADAQSRGARTASLQSTPMAQSLYRALGFQPVGRYEEWIAH
jgi:ribosomal protein S18 acetylase RimI-like enzyme